ncbi:MAG: hypothetical protein KatS3mg102_2230 [Planctomycetota bacterium]|nr:MAG: hypothetical protein KatS3mg102_2230 [Planctomycetota bacterium]
MAAVVRVRLERNPSRAIETSAVLNGGFATERPTVLLPRRAALALFPDYPAGSRPLPALTAGGQTTLRELGEPLWVRVLAGDREGPAASCRVLVSEAEDEVLLSDYAIDALGVRIEQHGPGIWRFADEQRTRASVPAEPW